MQVILLERIAKLGQMGETVKVRDGFARNFLLPQGKALRANEANKKQLRVPSAPQLEARNLERKSEATAGLPTSSVRQVLHRRAFGRRDRPALRFGVAARDVADLLAGRRLHRSAATRSC